MGACEFGTLNRNNTISLTVLTNEPKEIARKVHKVLCIGLFIKYYNSKKVGAINIFKKVLSIHGNGKTYKKVHESKNLTKLRLLYFILAPLISLPTLSL